MDELIARYAQALQLVYDNRTAGDHTFTGVLSEFALKVQEDLASAYEGVDYRSFDSLPGGSHYTGH